VCARLEERTGWRVLLYREMAWDRFQDGVAVFKAPIDRVLRSMPVS
jgi:hypothetical protein